MRALPMLALLAAPALAQGRDAEALRLRAELAAAVQQEQRLIGLRLAADLGLPLPEEISVPSDAERRFALGGRLRLEAEELELRRLRDVLAERERELRQARTAHALEPAPSNPPPAEPAVPAAPEASPAAGGEDPGEPGEATVPDEAPSPPRHRPPTPPLVLTGTTAEGSMARALLASGIARAALARAADREGRAPAAATLADEARSLLERARDELQRAIAVDEPALRDVFDLARAEEHLGNTAVAEDHYATVISRDRSIDREGRTVLGRFGRAAQLARAMMRWDRRTGGWHPRRDPSAILAEGTEEQR